MTVRLSDLPEMNAEQALELKASARQMSLHQNIPHATALKIVAEAAGYPNWMSLVFKAGGAERLRALQRRQRAAAKVSA